MTEKTTGPILTTEDQQQFQHFESQVINDESQEHDDNFLKLNFIDEQSRDKEITE